MRIIFAKEEKLLAEAALSKLSEENAIRKYEDMCQYNARLWVQIDDLRMQLLRYELPNGIAVQEANGSKVVNTK